MQRLIRRQTSALATTMRDATVDTDLEKSVQEGYIVRPLLEVGFKEGESSLHRGGIFAIVLVLLRGRVV